MLFIYYFFAVVIILIGFQSLFSGVKYLQYFRSELTKPFPVYTPFVSIIAPCRGLDDDLLENLAAIFQQNYPAYEIIFVVDDINDKAVPIIENLRGKFAGTVKSKIEVAGKATDSGQKVHNLRFAVRKTDLKSEIFVFVDSDARPHKNWLRSLVAPLSDENVGAATGYRWFISKKRNFASELLSVWNASIASALGKNSDRNFCWGGSTAIRRKTFEQINMVEKWRGTLSDDFALMRALGAEKLKIYFVPNCLTASIEDCSFAELVEFTNRQMKITRVYAPQFWKASFIGGFLFTAVFWTGIFLIVFRALFGLSFWLPLAFVALIFLLGLAKVWLRLEAVKLVLPEYRRELDKSRFSQLFFWILTPILYFYNGICAAFSREIVWRGILYKLKSPNETVIIANYNVSASERRTKVHNSSI